MKPSKEAIETHRKSLDNRSPDSDWYDALECALGDAMAIDFSSLQKQLDEWSKAINSVTGLGEAGVTPEQAADYIAEASNTIAELRRKVETLYATIHGMQDGAVVRDQMALIERLQHKVRELESYKAHHKTCLELAEEVNRDITLERRINSSLRSNVERQQAVIQELAEALRKIKSDPHGCVFCDSGKLRNPQKQHQERCGFALINAALQAAAPWLRKEGDAK